MPDIVKIKNINGKRMIQLPDNLQLEDHRYYLKKVGNVVHLIPVHDPWRGMMDAVSDFTEDYMENRDQPNAEKRQPIG